MIEAMIACLFNLYERGIVTERDGDAFDELEEIYLTLRSMLEGLHEKEGGLTV